MWAFECQAELVAGARPVIAQDPFHGLCDDYCDQIDDDLKQLIRGIEMPREFMDVERELQKAGMKPATNSARREAMAGVPRSQISKPQKKKRRESKRTKYTNAHLPELFKNIQVP